MSTFIAEKTETTNASASVVKLHEINLDDVIITKPKLGKNKKLTAAILNGKTNGALYLETPPLNTVFGLDYFGSKDGKDIKDEDKQWSFLLKPSSNKDYAEITEKSWEKSRLLFIEKPIDWGVENSVAIFKKKVSKETIAAKCTSQFKQNIAKDGTVYPEQINVKIPRNMENFLPNVLVFKNSPEPIEITSWQELQNMLPPNTLVQLIIQPQISFNSTGGYGINFKALQILILESKKTSKPSTYAFSTMPQIKNNAEDNKKSAEEDDEKEEITKTNEDFVEDSGSEVEIEDD